MHVPPRGGLPHPSVVGTFDLHVPPRGGLPHPSVVATCPVKLSSHHHRHRQREVGTASTRPRQRARARAREATEGTNIRSNCGTTQWQPEHHLARDLNRRSMYSVPLASSVKRRHDHGHDNDHIDARKKTRGAPISDEGSRDLKALLDDDVTPTTLHLSSVTFLHPPGHDEGHKPSPNQERPSPRRCHHDHEGPDHDREQCRPTVRPRQRRQVLSP